MKKLFMLLSVVIFSFAVIRCGGGGGGSDSTGDTNPVTGDGTQISVHGSIDSSVFAKKSFITKAGSGFQIIIVHSMDPLNLFLYWDTDETNPVHIFNDFGSYKGIEIVDVAADGSFSFNIDKGDIYVAFLVDPTQEFQKVIGVLGIGTEAGEYLEAVITQDLGDTSTINYGTITESTTGILSGNDIDSCGVTVSDQELINTIARMDDSVRSFANIINSGDQYSYLTTHLWEVQGKSNFVNMYSTINGYEYLGYDVSLLSLPDLGDTPYIVPSVDISTKDGSITYNAGNPLGTSGKEINVIGFNEFIYGFGEEFLFGTIPSGLWMVYKSDSTKIAEVDFSTANPYYSGTDYYSIPVPVIKVNTESDNDTVASIDIKWYFMSNTGTIMEITDISALTSLIGNFNFEIHNSDEETKDSIMGIPFSIAQLTNDNYIEHIWKVNSAGSNLAEKFEIGYLLNGVHYRFEYYCPEE